MSLRFTRNDSSAFTAGDPVEHSMALQMSDTACNWLCGTRTTRAPSTRGHARARYEDSALPGEVHDFNGAPNERIVPHLIVTISKETRA